MQTCPEGSFQNDDRCIACAGECSTCSSLDQCLACYETDESPEGKVFVDGRCIDTCPVGTVENAADSVCERSELIPSTNSTDPFGDGGGDIWQLDIEECQVENCASCGIDSNYCQTCEEGMLMAEGKCVTDCESGFFKADDRCYKCNPICSTCGETANQCTSCFVEADTAALFTQTLFVPSHQMCALECPAGTYHDALFSGHCLDCGRTCNTCSEVPGECTSCLQDKDTGQDLFLVESDNVCVQTCPVWMEADLAMHKCVPVVELAVRLKSWTTMLLIGSFVVLAVGLIVSGLASRGQCEYLEVASAILSMIESVNRFCLFAVLWMSEALILFCTVGACVLCNWLMTVLFIETTFLPVLDAMANARKTGETKGAKESAASKIVRLLAMLSGINTLRLLSSSFCGSSHFMLGMR